ncbi:2OG-Fe(II) oxygenase [Sphingomonas solaris]|nr:2OG-Fe(II) oxygenase family protein [Sphingomonas solaris]
MTSPLILADHHDADALAAAYARHGRVQIGGFLAADSARWLVQALAASTGWKLTLNRGETILDYDRTAFAALPEGDRAAVSRMVAAGGRDGFQFCYDVIRAADAMPPDAPLPAATHLFNRPETLDRLRHITGAGDIARADAHATRFGPGQFLTTHDDHIAGKGRRAAYVLNLTSRWRPDWGGLLLFYDAQGNVTRGFTPAFNTLTLFAVPQAHGVSWVTPLAAGPRHAITGWLLADEAAG